MSASNDLLRIAIHPVLGRDSRSAVIHIVFDGERRSALEGEPIAAALRAHGIRVNRTMPETQDPRGVFCGVGRCPDCMMTVDGELNVRACVRQARDGMVIETQQGLGVWTS